MAHQSLEVIFNRESLMKVSDLLCEFKANHRKKDNIFRDLLRPAFVDSDSPVIPIEKWREIDSPARLRKKFTFVAVRDRNRFVEDVLSHETAIGHFSTIKVSKSFVIVSVKTSNVDVVTELDQEFARAVDDIYREIVYENDPNGRG